MIAKRKKKHDSLFCIDLFIYFVLFFKSSARRKKILLITILLIVLAIIILVLVLTLRKWYSDRFVDFKIQKKQQQLINISVFFSEISHSISSFMYYSNNYFNLPFSFDLNNQNVIFLIFHEHNYFTVFKQCNYQKRTITSKSHRF